MFDFKVTGPQMKAIDQYTIEKIGIPSMVLMERAAMHVQDCVEKKIHKKQSIAVICGMGNNGADGVAVGRMLFLKGYKVSIYLVGSLSKASDEMKHQLKIARNIGVPFFLKTVPDSSHYEVFIDALLGIGLNKPVEGDYLKWIHLINQHKGLVFAVDTPSGLSATNGEVLGVAVQANYTITFGLMKYGLTTENGKQYAGEVRIGDIGYPEKVIRQILIKKV
ncbi:NAD(P)H-hydrate epimerase [Desemzia sp. RIT804]|uniref:NAD(P)H-hydrate epimerase n=1 Tax=Desemzia sp. RIT 804 TaxID=2810209 RepID=UPI0019512AB3|nr:NAD(P)H-hydrate epimerase [Desemzia sp. RIT 804]MBM6615898.1 NAD(P)H-hydrate epimerase [Desemzia sp. RIT 804]